MFLVEIKLSCNKRPHTLILEMGMGERRVLKMSGQVVVVIFNSWTILTLTVGDYAEVSFLSTSATYSRL